MLKVPLIVMMVVIAVPALVTVIFPIVESTLENVGRFKPEYKKEGAGGVPHFIVA